MPRQPRRAAPARDLRRDALAHREAILDAAQQVLARAGGGTVADVAAASGLTRATVYRHFPDRDAILDGLVARMAGPVVDGFVAELGTGPLPDAMERLAHRVVAYVSRNRPMVELVAPRLEQLAREAVGDEPLARALRRRRAAGDLGGEMSEEWIAASVRALCVVAVADRRPADEVAADLAATLRRLVQ